MTKTDLPNNDIEILIVSYLTGSVEEGDLTRLDEWIRASDENLSRFNKIKDAWILSGETKRESADDEAEASWSLLREKLDHSRLDLGFVGIWSREKVSFKKYLKLAASWLLIFGLGSSITWWLSGRSKITSGSDNGGIVEISAPLGARSMIKMPDGTVVWLNAGTTITYGQDYGRQSRTLNLSGEAYFSVARDSLHTFIVNTPGIIIRALGTRFNVKAYPEEKTISATLEEGRIDIRVKNMAQEGDRVLLKAKDKLIYHKETNETEKYTESPEDKISHESKSPVKLREINLLSNVRTELYTSWKDSRWIIYKEPLSTLAPMLERRFNLKIIFSDPQLKKYKFSGTIENETVDQLLKALKLTAPLDYQINKDTVRLTLDIRHKDDFKRIMTREN